MKELFDPKFVHFMWDDELEGKEGFFADDIVSLQNRVNGGDPEFLRKVHTKLDNRDFPFHSPNETLWRFFYYDPNYSIKKAYNEGKEIQFKSADDEWHRLDSEGLLMWYIETGCQLRVKPEEKKWIVYLNRVTKLDSRDCYLTACCESNWEYVQKECGAKTKLFVGTEEEVGKWYRARQKFADVIKAWEDGKAIQFLRPDNIWQNCVVSPYWIDNVEYRVKPEPEYRPYESSAEMIADFIDRFNVNCPSYAEPLIWVRLKQQDGLSLITSIFSHSVKINDTLCMLEDLYTCYTYRDGSPAGMKVKE